MKSHLPRTSFVVTAAAGLALAALVQTGRAEGNKVPLEVKTPKPQFQGTPTPIKLPNLEPAATADKPPFLVPAGTALLSEKREVTSSDQFPTIGDLTMVTDGDKEAIEGSYVELGPGKQWVQVDLGAPAKIQAIVVWLYHMQPRAYHDVVVQISNDADFIQGVTTVFNNDHDNSSGFGAGQDYAFIETNKGRIIDGKGVAGRYVRINTKGNTSNEMNHFTEVEVFGIK